MLLVFVAPGRVAGADLVILPGIARRRSPIWGFSGQGWESTSWPMSARRQGVGPLRRISDARHASPTPKGSRAAGAVEGLGLLDVETVLTDEKTLRGSGVNASPTARRSRVRDACRADGRPRRARPLLRLADGRVDGAISADGRVAGAYAHGLFANDRQRAGWLAWLGAASDLAYETTIERTWTNSPTTSRAHLDLDVMLSLAR